MYQPAALRRRAFLGLHVSRSPSDAAPRASAGLPVTAVLDGGAAHHAGLQPGDGLIALDAVELRDAEHLLEVARSLEPMRSVAFRFHRVDRVLEREAVAPPLPVEGMPGASIELGSVAVRGHRLRTLTAVPDGPPPHPAVLYLQGVRPESCEVPLDPRHPTARLVAGLADAGFSVHRLERAGVGDSEGPRADRTDLEFELDAYDAALEALFARADVDARRVFLFGQSYGGMLAPLLAFDRPLAGVVVFGTSAARWHDGVVAAIGRKPLPRPGADGPYARQRQLWIELHALVCREGWTPALAFERRPHLRSLCSRDCVGETLHGRHVSLFQQLDAIDLKAAWRAVGQSRCPVLVLHGQRDWVCSAEDARGIVECAGPGATLRELPGVGHDLLVNETADGAADRGADRWDASVVDATVEWMRRAAAQTFTSSQPPGKTHP